MKTDLSSQIKLDRVARKLYHPDNEIELAALTREEKINTYIFETANDGGEYLAGQIARYINRFVAEKGKCVLALGAGTSTHSAYAALIRMYKEEILAQKTLQSFQNLMNQLQTNVIDQDKLMEIAFGIKFFSKERLIELRELAKDPSNRKLYPTGDIKHLFLSKW